MGASFTHPSGSVDFRSGPVRPGQGLSLQQPTRQSSAGIPFGFAHTIVNDVMSLKLRATTAEKDLFDTWFHTVARGMAEEVVYIDPAGNLWTGRFEQSHFSAQERAFNAWEITIPFRVAP